MYTWPVSLYIPINTKKCNSIYKCLTYGNIVCIGSYIKNEYLITFQYQLWYDPLADPGGEVARSQPPPPPPLGRTKTKFIFDLLRAATPFRSHWYKKIIIRCCNSFKNFKIRLHVCDLSFFQTPQYMCFSCRFTILKSCTNKTTVFEEQSRIPSEIFPPKNYLKVTPPPRKSGPRVEFPAQKTDPE